MIGTQTFIGTLILETCCHENCGTVFGMSRELYDLRKGDHKSFYCPRGHSQYYTSKSDEEKLKDQIANLERQKMLDHQRRDELYQEIQQLNYSVRAQKAAKTKILNRVKNGVCPCCNRQFKDLQNHFKSKHPELLQ